MEQASGFPQSFQTKLTQSPLSAISRYHSPTLISCATPAAATAATASSLGHESTPVTVSNNGIDFYRSHVQFQYVADPVVTSVVPSTGPENGGIIVKVAGANFQDAPDLACRFGSLVVPAEFVSPSLLSCMAPPLGRLGRVLVSVSINGIDFSGSADALFAYTAEPTVYAATPSRGSTVGNTTVTVTGSNFKLGGGTFCRFGLVVTPATVQDSHSLTCTAPPTEVAGPVVLEVATNLDSLSFAAGTQLDLLSRLGAHFTTSGVEFTYDAPISVTALWPELGPQDGGTTVTLRGHNFVNSSTLCCRFGTVVVSAQLRSSTRLSCVSPPASAGGEVPVSASLNGVEFGRDTTNTFLYHKALSVTSVRPTRLRAGAGTEFRVLVSAEA